jgi:hypothetical protein
MTKFITPSHDPFERISVPIELEAGRTPEPVWTLLEKMKSLIYAGIRTLNHPASADEFVSEQSSYFQR